MILHMKNIGQIDRDSSLSIEAATLESLFHNTIVKISFIV